MPRHNTSSTLNLDRFWIDFVPNLVCSFSYVDSWLSFSRASLWAYLFSAFRFSGLGFGRQMFPTNSLKAFKISKKWFQNRELGDDFWGNFGWLGRVWGWFWVVWARLEGLEASWNISGTSWKRPRSVLGLSWGRPGAVLGPSRGRLGASWNLFWRIGSVWRVLKRLGASWRRLGSVLGLPWGRPGVVSVRFCHCWNTWKEALVLQK